MFHDKILINSLLYMNQIKLEEARITIFLRQNFNQKIHLDDTNIL